MNRRRFLSLVANAAVALSVPALAARASETRPIALHARKFEFSPSEIKVPAGREVTFAVTSSDFVHGFSMPDFGVRHDLVPGRTIEVTIRPANAGRFLFLCDNFCGDGHDKMTGVLVVA